MKSKKEARMRSKRKESTDKGWTPDVVTGEEALIDEERSLDIGESGQFAPGGYYNQRKINEPEKRTLDDIVVPPARS